MSRDESLGRRLDLAAALSTTCHAVPRMWRGAWLALAWAASTALQVYSTFGGPVATVITTIGAIFSLIAIAALTRIAVTDDLLVARKAGLGLGGFQVGRPELRLLGAALLCLLFLALIVTILGLVVLAIFGSAELDLSAVRARDWPAAGPAWQLALLGILGLVALAVPAMLAIRLSLFAPATVGRDRMTSLAAMGLSRIAFWPLTAGLLVTSVPGALFWGLSIWLGRGETPAILSAIGFWFVQAPLTIAFLGAAYRQLETWTPEGGRS